MATAVMRIRLHPQAVRALRELRVKAALTARRAALHSRVRGKAAVADKRQMGNKFPAVNRRKSGSKLPAVSRALQVCKDLTASAAVL